MAASTAAAAAAAADDDDDDDDDNKDDDDEGCLSEFDESRTCEKLHVFRVLILTTSCRS